MKKLSAQKELEAYLAIKDIDIEMQMHRVGNLEMVCSSTLHKLQNGMELPSFIKIIPRIK